MNGFWDAWFGWPNGSVLTNLIASALVGFGTALFTIRRVKKHLHTHHENVYTWLDDKLSGLLPGGIRPHLHHPHLEQDSDPEEDTHG